MTEQVQNLETGKGPAPATAAKRPAPLSYPAAAWAVFRTNGLDPLWGRKGLILLLFALSPILLLIMGAIFGAPRRGGSLIFIQFIVNAYHFISVVYFLFIGCSVLGGTLEDRTITYDMICPLPRSMIYAGKYLSYLACCMVVLLPVKTLAYIMCMSLYGMDTVVRNLPNLWAVLAATLLAALVYGAFYILLSLCTKRSVLIGIILTVALDTFIAFIPVSSISNLAVHTHLRNIMSWFSGERLFRLMVPDIDFYVDLEYGYSFLVLGLLWLLFTWTGLMLFQRKQLP